MTPYSIVVGPHSDDRQLLACLFSLRYYARPLEIILVAPPGPAVERLIALSRLQIRCIAPPAVGSLGAAYNLGLDAARSRLVLLVHRAVLQCDPAVAYDYLAEHPDVGVAGAKLFAPEPAPRRLWSAGYACGPHRLAPAPVGRLEWDTYHQPLTVDAVSCALMMIRRTTLRFDERYWFRLEDVDLCFQYRQIGYRTVLLPALHGVRLDDAAAAGARSGDSAGEGSGESEALRALRLIAGQHVYHQRWRSALPLEEIPVQMGVRGSAAAAHFTALDAQYRAHYPANDPVLSPAAPEPEGEQLPDPVSHPVLHVR